MEKHILSAEAEANRMDPFLFGSFQNHGDQRKLLQAPNTRNGYRMDKKSSQRFFVLPEDESLSHAHEKTE